MPGRIALVHYSAAPVVGGVEAVMQSQARLMQKAGLDVTVLAGRGEAEAQPQGVHFERIPQMDSRDERVAALSRELDEGRLPPDFEELTAELEKQLEPALVEFEHVIIHNIFTTRFNLPLTIALARLLNRQKLHGGIAWCHDFTWTSPRSGRKVHPGYPWDALRTYRPDLTYVTISKSRQEELAGLLEVPPEQIRVVYNGVEPDTLLGISAEGMELIDRLGVWDSDLVLLLPVRVAQIKNIEFAIQVIAVLKQGGLKPLLVVTGPPDPHDLAIMDYYQSLHDLRVRLHVEKETRFVYDSGPEIGQPFFIDAQTVGELYRVSDALLMPSHQEGFGMPVLEAGLVGLAVFCTGFPSAEELGGNDLYIFAENDPPEKVAGLIRQWAEASTAQHLRRQVRQGLTWKAIFEQDILPLLNDRGGE